MKKLLFFGIFLILLIAITIFAFKDKKRDNTPIFEDIAVIEPNQYVNLITPDNEEVKKNCHACSGSSKSLLLC